MKPKRLTDPMPFEEVNEALNESLGWISRPVNGQTIHMLGTSQGLAAMQYGKEYENLGMNNHAIMEAIEGTEYSVLASWMLWNQASYRQIFARICSVVREQAIEIDQLKERINELEKPK